MSDLQQQRTATPEVYNQTKGSIMICNTETDLHALLDRLTDGEHIKATWMANQVDFTAEGPVSIDGREVSCWEFIRWDSGTINSSLTSLEVTREEEVTVTRDDEGELHALLDSLEDGGTITAEWRDESGETTATLTGAVRVSGNHCWVLGFLDPVLFCDDRTLHPALHSVTVRRPVVHRWERGGNE